MSFWVAAYFGSVVGALLTVVAMTMVRNESRHSIGRIGWMFLVLLSPPIGLVLFLLLGDRKVSAEHRQRKTLEMPRCDVAATEPATAIQRMLIQRGLRPATGSNQIKIISSVVELRRRYLDAIASATETIYVMTFIFDALATATEVVDLLCEKASEGLQVRMLCDGFGSFQTSNEHFRRIIEAGGRAERFKPLTKIGRWPYLNFRNHRKLLVVDGKRAILGGANIVETEMTNSPDDRSWVDVSIDIEGPAVAQLQSVFRSDWKFATDEQLPPAVATVPAQEPRRHESKLTVMPIGPDGPTEVLDDFWLLAIERADDRIWVCTPYFVPPPCVMRSLEAACRRGVDVQVMVPDRSDLRPIDYVRYDYLDDLIAVGAKVLRYPDRMVHAKIGIVDHHLAIVGSANFDIRSFFLNYELSLVVHDGPTVERFVQWFNDLGEGCERGLGERSRWRSAVATAIRIFASEL